MARPTNLLEPWGAEDTPVKSYQYTNHFHMQTETTHISIAEQYQRIVLVTICHDAYTHCSVLSSAIVSAEK